MSNYPKNMPGNISVRSIIVSITLAIVSFSCSSDRSSEHNQVLANESGQTSPHGSHTSNNSLDWQGVYRGILPCADCAGIETRIVLKRDGSFEKSLTYLGKDDRVFTAAGKLVWDQTGNKITLKGEGGDQQYLVGENQLIHLDQQGNRIEGDLADRYKLFKNRDDLE